MSDLGYPMSQAVRGRRLLVVLSWALLALLALGLFAAGIPSRYDRLLQMVSENQYVFADLGLTGQTVAGYFTALDLLLVLSHVAVALVIIWMRNDNLLAVFVAVTLVTAPLAVIDAFSASPASWSMAADLVLYVGLVTSVSLLYVFPDGRFVPGWSRLAAALWALLNLPAVFFPDSPLSLAAWPRGLQVAVLLVVTGSGVHAQVFRFLRVSTPLERQQTKWAVFGLTAAILGVFGYYLQIFSLPTQSQAAPPTLFYNLADPAVFQFATLLQGAGLTAYAVAGLVFPISFAVAILRHHLFDIAVIVNRTLVYSLLSAVLGAIYAGSVVLFQAILRAVTGQGSPLAIVISTLAIAALFGPLRRQIQRLIDRRFYRRKYDAAQTLQAFAGAARNEVDMDRLTDELLRVVEETMRPEHVSLWLRPVAPRETRPRPGGAHPEG